MLEKKINDKKKLLNILFVFIFINRNFFHLSNSYHKLNKFFTLDF